MGFCPQSLALMAAATAALVLYGMLAIATEGAARAMWMAVAGATVLGGAAYVAERMCATEDYLSATVVMAVSFGMFGVTSMMV